MVYCIASFFLGDKILMNPLFHKNLCCLTCVRLCVYLRIFRGVAQSTIAEFLFYTKISFWGQLAKIFPHEMNLLYMYWFMFVRQMFTNWSKLANSVGFFILGTGSQGEGTESHQGWACCSEGRPRLSERGRRCSRSPAESQGAGDGQQRGCSGVQGVHHCSSHGPDLNG